MEVIRDLSYYKNAQEMAISLGMFDGVHLGHKAVVQRLKTISEQNNWLCGLFSFWPHPRKVINPEFKLQQLTNIEEKISILEKENIDVLFLQEFNEDFRNLSAEEFVEEILVKKLNVKYIIIGYDHRFGKNQSGDYNLLKNLGEKFGFEVEKIEGINIKGHNISSTKIRNHLLNSEIKQANDMLGYAYSISGEVIHGKKIGRSIGFPTANISIDETKLLPKKGAYIVEVWLGQKFYKGMLSIGTNPTVNGQKLSVEVYILDFSEDIYGKELTIKFRDFLHEEIKFETLEKLIERLEKDKELTSKFSFF